VGRFSKVNDWKTGVRFPAKARLMFSTRYRLALVPITKGKEFLHKLSNYYILKINYAPRGKSTTKTFKMVILEHDVEVIHYKAQGFT
jgi:hypothetical protein